MAGPIRLSRASTTRRPIGELLPVYLNRPVVPKDDGEYRLVLTREGWLQPWVRVRKTEDEENKRLAGMSSFHTLSRSGEIKPGAVVLSEVQDSAGAEAPALVAQSFGKGHVAALLIGDLWRWGMRRENQAEDDFDRSWRQTVRWLVGDVPGRVEVTVRPKRPIRRPRRFAWLFECAMRNIVRSTMPRSPFAFSLPGGENSRSTPSPTRVKPVLTRRLMFRESRVPIDVVAAATAPDGSVIGEQEAGWAAQPVADEFARLEPDREFLKSIASKTGGEVVDGERLAVVRRQPFFAQRTDHRAVDFSAVASTALFSGRDCAACWANGA